MTANKKSALNANGVFGDTSDYTVVLDESNAYTSGSTKEVTTSSGSWQISFAYTNASSLSGGHVTLANGGTLVNTRDIISIDYLKVHCSGTGTLQFRTSYDGATWGGYATIYYSPDNSFIVWPMDDYLSSGEIYIDIYPGNTSYFPAE